jgi:hypothetical protein
MAHVPRNGTNLGLRRMYVNILNHAYTLSGAGNNPAWRYTPGGIAFPLLGCTDGYGYNNSAEQALATIESWFNHPTQGGARRAAIRRVDLMCPRHHKAGRDRIEYAWRRAWE